jgi:3-hydroxyacyl-CoA dehydrogenase
VKSTFREENLRDKIHRVLILGANGTMGAGAAQVFAGAGCHVTMLAREIGKAEAGLKAAQTSAKAEALAERITLGTYEHDLKAALPQSDFIFESLAEDLSLKQSFFRRVDQDRRPNSVVASGSSGLSISSMARGRSDSFRRHFLGVHLFNPPHVVVGTEVIPHEQTDSTVTTKVVELLERRLGRKVIVTNDRPAFVGNRVGFKFLNEAAQLAQKHGVAYVDYLLGSHTGRAMAPLATIDLVGWDVHMAIVDNVFANCRQDEAHACFKLPEFMNNGIAKGQLGDKAPQMGGFYRKYDKRIEVLDHTAGTYRQFDAPKPVEFVERMKAFHRVGKYREAIEVLRSAKGGDAEICQRMVIGYVSYALNRVGEVAHSSADVDRIMSYGFNWTAPGVLADLLGHPTAIEMMRRFDLKVPPVLEEAASVRRPLFAGGILDYGRTFAA